MLRILIYYSLHTIYKAKIVAIFPLQNIENYYPDQSLMWHASRKTFAQKIVDTFKVIGGDSKLLLSNTEPDAAFPITLKVNKSDYPFNGSLLTWSPLVVVTSLLLLIAYGLAILFISSIDRLSNGEAATKARFAAVLGIVIGAPLIIAGAIIYTAVEATKFLLALILTLVSLPIIGAIHLFEPNLSRDIKDFEQKYDAQNVPDTAQEVHITATHNRNSGFKSSIVSQKNICLHAPVPLLESINTSLRRALGEECRATPVKMVIIEKINRHDPNTPTYLFYKFNYSQKGREALNALQKLHPHLFVKGAFSSKDRAVSDMIYRFWVLLQMSRDNNQIELPVEMIQAIAAKSEDLFTHEDRMAILEQSTVLTRFYANQKGIGIFTHSDKSSPKVEEITDEAELMDMDTAKLK